MATQNDFTRSFSPNVAMSAWRRVTLSATGTLTGYSSAFEPGVGVLQEDVIGASYENPKVRFYGTGSVAISVTGCPATAGNTMYAVANGQVAPTAATPGLVTMGTLLGNVTTNGTLGEVLPSVQF